MKTKHIGLIGTLVGSYIGGSIGKFPGALIGAFLGYKAEKFLRQKGRSNDARSPFRFRRDPLAEAYALLGARASDNADELKRKYRELARRNHPDVLRARGLSEEKIGKATDRMSRINAAWATIREARGL